MSGIALGLAALVGVAFGGWGLTAVVMLLGIVVLRTWPNAPLSLCLVILAVASVAAWRGATVRAIPREASLPDVRAAIVASLPTDAGRYQHFVVTSLSVAGGDDAPPARICVVANPIPRVRLGDQVEIDGSIESRQDAAPGFRAYLDSRDCAGSMFATFVRVTQPGDGIRPAIGDTRSRLSQVLRGAAPGDAGILLAGLVTGDDAALSDERQLAFVATGTTHLTAVSGANLALIAGLLAVVGRNSLGQHHRLWQAVTILGVWSYAVISGAQAPTIRAAIVAMAAILAMRFGRAPDFPTLILFAAGVMVLLDPAQIDRLGFRLSIAAALAITVVLPGFADAGAWGKLARAITAVVAAQLATLPFLFAMFGTISLLSVPANLLVAPLVALAMPVAALAAVAGLVAPPLAEFLVTPAALAANGILAIVDVLGTPRGLLVVGIPPAPVVVVLAFASLAGLLALSPELVRSQIVLRSSDPAESTPEPALNANESRLPVEGGGNGRGSDLSSGGGGGDRRTGRPIAHPWTPPWQRGRRASQPGNRSSGRR